MFGKDGVSLQQISLTETPKTVSIMGVFILNKCISCCKKVYTTRTSTNFVCEQCGNMTCPNCKGTDTVYLVGIYHRKRKTEFIRCLSSTCLFKRNQKDDNEVVYLYTKKLNKPEVITIKDDDDDVVNS